MATVATAVAWRQVLRQLAATLQGSGLDLLAPLSVEWYNAIVPPALRLPHLGREAPPLAILVGNSKAIWEPFIFALRSQPSLLASPHPLNSFVKQSLTGALVDASFFVIDSELNDLSPCAAVHTPASPSSHPGCCTGAIVYWDYDTRPGKLLAMQRLAHSAGMAFFDEASHFCVHPKYGPWFALRALVLFDVDAPTDEERPPLLRSLPSAVTAPTAVEKQRDRIRPRQSASNPKELWRQWLAVRDAIHPDHPMRYESDQIEYHYTHNLEILNRVVGPTSQTSDRSSGDKS